MPYAWKKYHKNERDLRLVSQILTSSPNFHRMCFQSIRTFQFIYMPDVTARYVNSLDFIVFFGHFHTSFTTIFMSQLLYLHQTFTDCVSNWYPHFGFQTFQIWLQVLWFSLRRFIASSNFYKLCFEAEAQRWKVNLCNHLWLRQSEFFDIIQGIFCVCMCVFV